MVPQLITGGKLVAINRENVPNMAHLEPEFENPGYDPGNVYSVPYLWTVAGIAYNTKFVEKSPRSWKQLFSPVPMILSSLDRRVALVNNPTQNMCAAFLALGYDSETSDHGQIRKGLDVLKARETTYQFESLKNRLDAFGKGDLYLGMAYSADVARMGFSHIHFALPEEGSWAKVDTLAIPAGATPKQKEIAEALINFLLEPKMTAKVVNFSYHAGTIGGETPFLKSGLRNGPVYMMPPLRERMFLQLSAETIEALQKTNVKGMSEDEMMLKVGLARNRAREVKGQPGR